ncbi:hypothetical protein NDU88_005109 [Pleurodeles waltl]|uniref:Uncharacterized protein n=1 Tax=Pleurodeles waltl TaxID=8319 RepID=A0AAV7QEQ4_PLEWA|nr:hypothetical protein NDU88_005109 [Pleurodeles waltl]
MKGDCHAWEEQSRSSREKAPGSASKESSRPDDTVRSTPTTETARDRRHWQPPERRLSNLPFRGRRHWQPPERRLSNLPFRGKAARGKGRPMPSSLTGTWGSPWTCEDVKCGTPLSRTLAQIKVVCKRVSGE